MDVTIKELCKMAEPGDILLGSFPNPLFHCINPIILIGECVMCILGKPEVLKGVEYFLKCEGDKYIKYKVVR